MTMILERMIRKNKTQTSYELDVTSLSHEGRGIAHFDNKITFVDGALPGEKVICNIIKKHRRYNEAQISEILKPSPKRITPQCQHFNICGGCSIQHIEMAEELQFKQKAVLEQLLHIGKVTPKSILPPLSGKHWGYRRRARLGVRYVIKKEKLMVGFREKQSNYLTDIQSCEVLHPRLNSHLDQIKLLISNLSAYQSIPQIEASVGDQDAALVIRHLSTLPEEDIVKIKQFAENTGFHIYLQPNSPAKLIKLWPEDQFERLTYSLLENRLEMYFHPLDFIQVNKDMNEAMVELALDFLKPLPDETVLDLFSGLGNFTLAFALHAKKVVGVEGSSEMVERAKENAQHNALTNTAFYAANLFEPQENMPWMKQSYDKILLDPPRTGAQEIIPVIADFSAKKVLYISCNPATLARDAGILVNTYGYQCDKLAIINMFPHTSHVETAALFIRQ